MTKITASKEKLQDLLHYVEQIGPSDSLRLEPASLAILRAGLGSLMSLYELLHGGAGIRDVRALFGVEVKKNDNQGQDGDDKESRQNSSGSPETSEIGSPGSTDNTNDESKDTDSGEAQCKTENATDKQTGDTKGNQDSGDAGSTKNQNHQGRSSVDDYPNAPRCEHTHPELRPGDVCPECLKGKLKFDKPRERLLFQGSSPISPVKHIFHDLICNLCGQTFKAPASTQSKEDGLGEERLYGYSAISMIAILKYFSDLPLYRSAKLHGMHGVNLAPSSQFDQAEKLANALNPIHKLEGAMLALFPQFLADDATARVLDKLSEIKENRTTGKPTFRDGCHSSVVIGIDDLGHPLVKIKTDIIHSGELLDEILQNRPPDLPPPKITWDRCSTNTVTACEYIDTACNQHAR